VNDRSFVTTVFGAVLQPPIVLEVLARDCMVITLAIDFERCDSACHIRAKLLELIERWSVSFFVAERNWLTALYIRAHFAVSFSFVFERCSLFDFR
jgi:hypothetical protein